MNFPSTLFAGRRYAVLGLGRNGLPAARALMAMGADVVAWDDRERPDGLELRDPTAEIGTFDALVLSPGIPHRLPAPHPVAAAALLAGVPVLSDADLFYQAVRAAGSRARFVGVTGTNGKSTTTALVAHILAGAGLEVAAGGNLGPAALALPLLGHNGLYVLEMSSYMLERIGALRFDAAAMLNLSPDHLDRHGDMPGYAAAKRAVFARQRAGDLAVVGVDDALSRAMAAALGATTISGEGKADIWTEAGILRDALGPILPMADAQALPGAHNAQNAAAASAIALHFGVSRADVARGIASFPGLPHRQQRVAVVDGVPYVDDSKATNADAAARALGCYDRIIWIAGGIAKAGGVAPLAPFFPRIAHALLIGRDARLLAGDLAGVPHSTPGTLEAAIPAARDLAARMGAEVVLLSPACASFDQFSGFEARGRRFAELAQNLSAGGPH
jgi:UDP-N-acetylmuramoylalanine--D-glutamate ligase